MSQPLNEVDPPGPAEADQNVLSLVSRVSTSFVDVAADDLTPRINQVLSDLGKTLCADRTFLCALDEGETTGSVSHMWAAPGIENTRSINQAIAVTDWSAVYQLQANTPFKIASLDDLPSTMSAERRFLEARNVKSILIVPLLLGDGRIGFIGMDMVRAERKWPEFYLDILRLIGEIVVGALENQRAAKRLRDSQSLYEAVVSQQGELIIRFDASLNVAFVNNAFLGFFGMPMDKAIGNPFMHLVPEDRRQEVLDLIATLTPDNPDADVELPMTMSDGETRWVQWSGRGEFDELGRLIECQAVGHDITELRGQQDRLRHSLLQQNAVVHILQASLVPKRNLGRVFDEVLRVLTTLPWIGNAAQGAVFLKEPDTDALILKASHQLTPAFVLGHSRVELSKDGPYTEAARTRQVTHVEAQVDGRKECYCVPICEGDQTLGVLMIMTPKPPCESAVWTGFFEALSNSLAVVIRRKQTELELLESEGRIRGIFDNVQDGVVTIDLLGRLESCNPAAGRILGYEPSKLAGQPLALVLPAMRQSGSPRDTLRDLSGKPATEFAAEHHGGHTLPVELTVSTMALGDRQLFVCIFRDITRRKEVEEVLISAKEEAEAANYAKSLFLATMSHELRTPLNSVIGFAKLLCKNDEGNLSLQQTDKLERILRNGHRLLDLITDVLDLSKIDAGKIEPVLTPVPLRGLIEDALASFSGRSGIVELRSEIPAGIQPLRTDSARLRQVLVNLVENAVKFTEDGSVMVKVVANEDGSPAAIDVSDTGIGIPDDMTERIFDAFVQVDSSSTRKYDGTGLGLRISRGLCNVLGYELTVESVLGKGSTFIIDLAPMTD